MLLVDWTQLRQPSLLSFTPTLRVQPIHQTWEVQPQQHLQNLTTSSQYHLRLSHHHLWIHSRTCCLIFSHCELTILQCLLVPLRENTRSSAQPAKLCIAPATSYCSHPSSFHPVTAPYCRSCTSWAQVHPPLTPLMWLHSGLCSNVTISNQRGFP
jgi:hypothetical protein